MVFYQITDIYKLIKKSVIFLSILFVFSPLVVSATSYISTNYVATVSTSFNASCYTSVNNYLRMYNVTTNSIPYDTLLFPCTSSYTPTSVVFSNFNGHSRPVIAGVYALVEVNASGSLTGYCGTNESYTTCKASSKYVSEQTFYFINPPPTPPTPTNLFNSDSASSLTASIGEVSVSVFNSASPYMFLVIGVGVTFYLLVKLKEVMPKEKKEKTRTYEIEKEISGGVAHTVFKEVDSKKYK